MNPAKSKKKSGIPPESASLFEELAQLRPPGVPKPPVQKVIEQAPVSASLFEELAQLPVTWMKVPISTIRPALTPKEKIEVAPAPVSLFEELAQLPVTWMKVPTPAPRPKVREEEVVTEAKFDEAIKRTGKWQALLVPFLDELKGAGLTLNERYHKLLQLSEEGCFIGGTSYTCYSVVANEVWSGEKGCVPGGVVEIGGERIVQPARIGERYVLEVECEFFDFLKRNFELLRELKEGKLKPPKKKPIKKRKKLEPTPALIREKEEKRKERKFLLEEQMEDYLFYLDSVMGTEEIHRGRFLEHWRREIEAGNPLPFNVGRIRPEMFYERWVPLFSVATDPAKTYTIEYIESDAGWLDPEIKIDPMIMATYNAKSPLRKKGIIGYTDQKGNPIDPEDPISRGMWGRRASLAMVLYFNWLVDQRWGTNYMVQQYNEARVKEADKERKIWIEPQKWEPEKERVVSTYRARYRNRKPNRQRNPEQFMERRKNPPVEGIREIYPYLEQLLDLLHDARYTLPGIDLYESQFEGPFESGTREFRRRLRRVRNFFGPLTVRGPGQIASVLMDDDLLEVMAHLSFVREGIVHIEELIRARMDRLSGRGESLLDPLAPSWAQPLPEETYPEIARLEQTAFTLYRIRSNIDEAMHELKQWQGRKRKEEQEHRRSIQRWERRTTTR